MFLRAYEKLYTSTLRGVLFRRSAQESHDHLEGWLRRLDSRPVQPPVSVIRRLAYKRDPVTVGGVTLEIPLIVAAGLVKGPGFKTEAAALNAVQRGKNIIPGWRGIPRLAGPVEFGSYTRWPRVGNDGIVVWRDEATRSSQNRVGLRNPGAMAAAEFLARHKRQLPRTFGINIAVSPGVDDPVQQAGEVAEAFDAFLSRSVIPAWFTLNLSCPNTEDDPAHHQTETQARAVCSAALDTIRRSSHAKSQVVPLWVKLGPTLGNDQYRALLAVLAELGVRAVIATNTLPQPSPNNPGVLAGVGGGQLHAQALAVAGLLTTEIAVQGYDLDVIGCGGVGNGITYNAFATLGIKAMQYWTALIFRGPLAGALILNQAKHGWT